MTVYFNPARRSMRHRMLDEMLREWDQDYEPQVSFPIDVMADNDSFVVKALLPGVQADDLDIQIVNEIVTISGELKSDRVEDANYLLTERPNGKFHRVLTLPTPLNPAKVEADLENGILTLRIPKAEEAKPHSIKIKTKG